MSGVVVALGDRAGPNELSVYELFVGVALAGVTLDVGEDASVSDLARTLGAWFRRAVPCADVLRALRAMEARGLAVQSASGRFRVTPVGRRSFRSHYSDVIRMLDRGAHLLDVAILLSLTREFDGGKDEAE